MSNDDEIIWNAGPIGKVIRRSRSQTYMLLERGKLPARKIEGRWAARRGDLLDLAKWPAVDEVAA